MKVSYIVTQELNLTARRSIPHYYCNPFNLLSSTSSLIRQQTQMNAEEIWDNSSGLFSVQECRPYSVSMHSKNQVFAPQPTMKNNYVPQPDATLVSPVAVLTPMAFTQTRRMIYRWSRSLYAEARNNVTLAPHTRRFPIESKIRAFLSFDAFLGDADMENRAGDVLINLPF